MSGQQVDQMPEQLKIIVWIWGSLKSSLYIQLFLFHSLDLIFFQRLWENTTEEYKRETNSARENFWQEGSKNWKKEEKEENKNFWEGS